MIQFQLQSLNLARSFGDSFSLSALVIQVGDLLLFGKLIPQGVHVLTFIKHPIFVNDLLSSVQQLLLLLGVVHNHFLKVTHMWN